MLLIRAKSSLYREPERDTSRLPRRVHPLSRIDHRLGRWEAGPLGLECLASCSKANSWNLSTVLSRAHSDHFVTPVAVLFSSSSTEHSISFFRARP